MRSLYERLKFRQHSVRYRDRQSLLMVSSILRIFVMTLSKLICRWHAFQSHQLLPCWKFHCTLFSSVLFCKLLPPELHSPVFALPYARDHSALFLVNPPLEKLKFPASHPARLKASGALPLRRLIYKLFPMKLSTIPEIVLQHD